MEEGELEALKEGEKEEGEISQEEGEITLPAFKDLPALSSSGSKDLPKESKPAQPAGALYSKLCREFSKGHCRFGATCRFLHEDSSRNEHEDRPPTKSFTTFMGLDELLESTVRYNEAAWERGLRKGEDLIRRVARRRLAKDSTFRDGPPSSSRRHSPSGDGDRRRNSRSPRRSSPVKIDSTPSSAPASGRRSRSPVRTVRPESPRSEKDKEKPEKLEKKAKLETSNSGDGKARAVDREELLKQLKEVEMAIARKRAAQQAKSSSS